MELTTYTFTNESRDVMRFAREEAAKHNHEYIGTEHLLLGLLDYESDDYDTLVRQVGIDRDAVRAAIEQIVTRGKSPAPSLELAFTSRAKRVLELAMESARDIGTTDVGPKHLLMGLCAEERGIGAQVLVEAGVTTEVVAKALRA